MMKSIWTSFFKARLNCSIPGEYPFYLDEIRKCQQIFFNNLFSDLVCLRKILKKTALILELIQIYDNHRDRTYLTLMGQFESN